MNNLYFDAKNLVAQFFGRLAYEYNSFDVSGSTRFADLTVKITDLIQNIKTDEDFVGINSSSKIESLFQSYFSDEFSAMILRDLMTELRAAFTEEEYRILENSVVTAVWTALTYGKLVATTQSMQLATFKEAVMSKPWLIVLILIRYTLFPTVEDE